MSINHNLSWVYPKYLKEYTDLNLQEKCAGRVLGWENLPLPEAATYAMWVGWMDAARDNGHIEATFAQKKFIQGAWATLGIAAPTKIDLDYAPKCLREVYFRLKIRNGRAKS